MCRHPDIVTAVAFHPLQDRYFISGCFDRKLRVWDVIPDPTVLEWTQTTDTVSRMECTIIADARLSRSVGCGEHVLADADHRH